MDTERLSKVAAGFIRAEFQLSLIDGILMNDVSEFFIKKRNMFDTVGFETEYF